MLSVPCRHGSERHSECAPRETTERNQGPHLNRLRDKVALVTGSARGIGEAIARAFIAEGAFVLVTDINHDRGAAVARELGDRASYQPLDVREEDQWLAAMKAVTDRHGHLDVLVNNAGITGFEAGLVAHDPEHATLEAWRAVHRTNLDGVFLGCKYAIRAMRTRRSGSIINISSRSGLVGIPGAAAYAASKAGVRNHTKTVALYCAEQELNIRCNSIHPAAILTPLWEPLLGTGPRREERMRLAVRDTPLRRFGTPDEVAALAVLLASDEAAYMTGAELTVDGGLLAGSVASPLSGDPGRDSA
jgi:NAD(P)-dependent dehydrogenase (short-subunit alcohol dehydrogenase family)